MSHRLAFALAASLGFACASAPASTSNAVLPEGHLAFRMWRTDGRPFGLGALRGKVVLLTVLATWSDPALVETKLFEELSASHGEALEVVAIVLDENREMVRIFESTFSPRLIVTTVEDPQRFTGADGPLGPIAVMPTSVLLNREGRIIARMDGMWPPALLRDTVEAAIAAPDGR